MENSILLAHSKHNYAQGIDVLYDRYAAPLYGIILRIVKTEQEAEFILVNVFIVIADQINEHSDTLHRFTWMMGIARSEALKYKTGTPSLKKENIKPYQSWAASILCLELTEGLSASSISVFQKVYLENETLLATSQQFEIPLSEVMILLRETLQHINGRMKVSHSHLMATG